MGRRSRPGLLPHGLVILHEDQDILVVDKPAGLLTIGTERDKSRTAYFILTDYVRKGCARSRNRVFIVHRLDRETSGVLVFAKSEEAKFRLQGEWSETEKKYLAVVHGRCRKQRGDHHHLPGGEQGPRRVLHVRSCQGKAVPYGLSSAQADEGLCLAGSGLADGQEEPDPRASRRDRTPHRGRQKVRERGTVRTQVWHFTPGRSPSSTLSAASGLLFQRRCPGTFNKLVGGMAHDDRPPSP